MKLRFYGAAQEVGKSCVELVADSHRYLLDAGIKFTSQGTQYPRLLERVRDIDGVFLTHAHLDHSGALPLLEHRRLRYPIYSTDLTWRITQILLEDAYHIQQLQEMHPAYRQRDILRVKEDLAFVSYGEWYTAHRGSLRFQFLNSGHIPGGASVLIEAEGKRLLYTSDINTRSTRLMTPASFEEEVGEVDTLIIEGTYGNRFHPPRQEMESLFLQKIQEILERGGSVLVPAFGVGRSQEILLLLSRLSPSIPLYLDGMARTLTPLIATHQDPYVRSQRTLLTMLRRARIVSRGMRRRIARERGVIILSPSGMLQGGPSTFYASHFVRRKQDGILLTGYQVQGTRGRVLLEDRMWSDEEGRHVLAQCEVQKFDFSAHYDREDIARFLQSIPHKTLVLQHGEKDALEAIASSVRAIAPETRVFLPQEGDTFEV